MPRGTFEPLKDPIRLFGRLHAFEVECPFCGRLAFVGPGARDAASFDSVTSCVTCPADRGDHAGRRGCGRRFLAGVILWPIRDEVRGGAKPQPPPDQIPEPHQLAEIRAEARRQRSRRAMKN